MGININCIYCDKYLVCRNKKRKKFLWIFSRSCSEAYGGYCELRHGHPRPIIPQQIYSRLNNFVTESKSIFDKVSRVKISRIEAKKKLLK